jgi:hypothetical protein
MNFSASTQLLKGYLLHKALTSFDILCTKQPFLVASSREETQSITLRPLEDSIMLILWKILVLAASMSLGTSQKSTKSPSGKMQRRSRPPGVPIKKSKKSQSRRPNKPESISKSPTLLAQNTVLNIFSLARTQIISSIVANPPIAATYLRLGFHDCVPNGAAGGCDGCVNLVSHTENNGLKIAIQSLAPIVTSLENQKLGISRADLWAYAALVAAEHSQTSLSFTDSFQVGRKNCETVGTCSSKDPIVCASNGPDQATDFPSTDVTTHGLLTFMSEHFGFNAIQTVAIMGAHSIGRALPRNSGFQNAWDSSNQVLGTGIIHLASRLNLMFLTSFAS